jgi:ABC-type polysaccharide/polyol phosphate export permease
MSILNVFVFFGAVVCVLILSVSLAYILGLITSRYRDVSPAISSIMQVVFYITPVIWPPEMLASHQYLLDFNPLYYFLDFLRAPLLGKDPNWYSVVGSVIITFSLVVISTFVVNKYKNRLVFWL